MCLFEFPIESLEILGKFKLITYIHISTQKEIIKGKHFISKYDEIILVQFKQLGRTLVIFKHG